MSHAEHHNILYPLQHGFRPGRSCETQTQLLEIVYDVVNNMQLGLQTDICVMSWYSYIVIYRLYRIVACILL